MDRITIYSHDRAFSITMPRTKEITVGKQALSKGITMASGKVVKDVIGFRTTVKAGWDYVPADAIVQLIKILQGDEFCFVEYPSPQGDACGYFDIAYPTLTIFGFKDGIAIWHDVNLTMSAQEVE